LSKKISDKDLKDWKNFLDNNEKVQNKDYENLRLKVKKEATIDLHGFSLENANKKVKEFIQECYQKGVGKINIITGKGLRSKVNENPFQSKDLGILKYSVPEFVKSSDDLMDIIKQIDDQTENKNSGSFFIHLKLKNKF
tara:strand:- start:4008 stop:4424 length:417 start_codon:yes stop_codon:yes gene_type:complete